MKIKIAQKLRPFSHTPGAECLIPKTWWRLQAFPTLLCFIHLEKTIELGLGVTGPVKEFTLEQDLEGGVLRVFGKAKEGYFRLRIEAVFAGFEVFAEKVPSSGLATTLGLLQGKEKFLIPASIKIHSTPQKERLSLGSHKKLDWDEVRRRMDLKEFLPPLFLLAELTPRTDEKTEIFSEKILKKESFLTHFFQAHFTKMLVPRLVDDQHQGFSFTSLEKTKEPCVLIQEVFDWVRSFFIEIEQNNIHLLPDLPSSFVCGRFLHLTVEGFGVFDLEWSNGTLRKAIFHSKTSREIFLKVEKEIRSFRIRTNPFEKGGYQKTTEPFMVKAETSYFLDRFQS